LNAQECCNPDDLIKDYVYAQPCTCSTASSGWCANGSCSPYLELCYVQEITEGATVDVFFAFNGACWFLDGDEDVIVLEEGEERPEFGFGIGTIENGDGEVYDTCADCCADDQNERWYKFEACESNELKICYEGTASECDLCDGYEDSVLLVPARFIEGIETGNSCDTQNEGTGMDACRDETSCRFMLDYRSRYHDRTEEDTCTCSFTGCCYKSCEEDDPVIITSISACDSALDVNDCCDIWTPKWKHDINGGDVDCASTYGDTGVPHEGDSGDPPYMWRGCCACSHETIEPVANTQLCRVFDGMTTWTYTFTMKADNRRGGCIGIPPTSLSCDYCCGLSTTNVTLNFTVHPEDADNGYYSHDTTLHTYHCIHLNEGIGDACINKEGDASCHKCCLANACDCADGAHDCTGMPNFTGMWCKIIGTPTASDCASMCDAGAYDICDPCDWCVQDNCGSPCAGETCACGGEHRIWLFKGCAMGQSPLFNYHGLGWDWMSQRCTDNASGTITGALLRMFITPETPTSFCSRNCCQGVACGGGADGETCGCTEVPCMANSCIICTTNKVFTQGGVPTDGLTCTAPFNSGHTICFPYPDDYGEDGECLPAP